LQFLIENDVDPLTPPRAGLTYQMRRSTRLDGTDWIDVGAPFTGGTTNTFTDPNVLEKAFYAIFEVAP